MNDKITVLDHGYVQLIESWGSDERIVEAARMSTDKGFLGWGPKSCPHCGVGTLVYGKGCQKCNFSGQVPGDEKLLRYLYEHKHMTPFEMAGMTIEVQAPIFVFREWHRHRTQSYNELSARYTPVPNVNYTPTVERCNPPATGNKQAQKLVSPDTGKPATPEAIALSHGEWLDMLNELYTQAEYVYQQGLLRGVPKEIARLPMPAGRYSRMRASANLRNWLQFLTLRMDPAAQWEIRQYANEVAKLVGTQFPRTHTLFVGKEG